MSLDLLDSTGLQTQTLTDLIASLTAAFQSIYGSKINIDSASADGQIINIHSQAAIDLRNLLISIYNSFDPDQATGVTLDQRVAINGLKRIGGTFTVQNVNITTDRALNLQGLDTQSTSLTPTNSPYTIKDNSGNQFYLLASQTIAVVGTYTYAFRAANLGLVQTTPNTIQTAVTIIAGVTTINNPSAATTTGQDEESDAGLKTRRKISTALSSIGYLDSLQSALSNLTGVTAAFVYENNTGSVDSNSTPANTVWAIVKGGTSADIANVLYTKKSSGSGMRGSQSYTIVRSNGSTWNASWDNPISQNLYIRLTVSLPNSGVIDKTNMKSLIVSNVSYLPGAQANASDITYYVRSLNSNYIVTSITISKDNGNWFETVTPTNSLYQFVLSVANITIS